MRDEHTKSKKLQYIEYTDEFTGVDKIKVMVPNATENIIEIVTYYAIEGKLPSFKLFDLRSVGKSTWKSA